MTSVKEMLMLKITIDKNKWLRGEGNENSFLLRASDGKMCCLGFLALKLGFSKEDIVNKGFDWQLSWPGGLDYCQLMKINDANSPDLVKEVSLKRIFEQGEVILEFIN